MLVEVVCSLSLTMIRYYRGAKRRLRTQWCSYNLKSMGKDCQICGGVLITGHENVSLGDRVTVNDQVIIQSCEGASITIGNDVTLSYRAMLITGGLIVDNDDAAHRWHQARPVVLGDSVWVAAGAIVLPGVTVGTGAIVAAGSVVTQDVDVHTVVAGRPAKVIRVLEQMNR